jgi:hypothetical protein
MVTRITTWLSIINHERWRKWPLPGTTVLQCYCRTPVLHLDDSEVKSSTIEKPVLQYTALYRIRSWLFWLV